MPSFYVWLLQLAIYQGVFGALDHLIPRGYTKTFSHEISVYMESELIIHNFRGFKASNVDESTFVISANISDYKEFYQFMYVSLNNSDVTNVWYSDDDEDLNYKKTMASLLLLPITWAPREYHPMWDSFGLCEWEILSSDKTIVKRNLNRCSGWTLDMPLLQYTKIPIFDMFADKFGSSSTCEYDWSTDSQRELNGINCTDIISIGPRFSDSKVKLRIESKIVAIRKEAEKLIVTDGKRQDWKDTLVQRPIPMLSEEEENSFMGVYNEWCLLRKSSIKILVQHLPKLLKAIRNTKNVPTTGPKVCYPNLRKIGIFVAATFGGSKYLTFVNSEIQRLRKRGEKIIPNYVDPAITLAISNLASPGQEYTPEMAKEYDKLITFLMEEPLGSYAGLAGLFNKLRTVARKDADKMQRESTYHVPIQKACLGNDTAYTAGLLHSVSRLESRSEEFIRVLRPCLHRQNPEIYLAVMESIKHLKLPRTIKAKMDVLMFPADPELRISAFQGLINHIPFSEKFIGGINEIFDENHSRFSKQVASYIYSYLQTILEARDPTQVRLYQEVINSGLNKLKDPVSYDYRRHSRIIEKRIVLDHNIDLIVRVDIIWGRTSLFPSTISVSSKVLQGSNSIEFLKIAVRASGLKNQYFTIPFVQYIKDFFNIKPSAGEIEMLDTLGNWNTTKGFTTSDFFTFFEKVRHFLPQNFHVSGLTTGISIDLFGQPIYHVYAENFVNYLTDLITHLKSFPHLPDYEVWGFYPWLANSLHITNTAGIPLSIDTQWYSFMKFLYSHKTREAGQTGLLNIGAAFDTVTEMSIGDPRDKVPIHSYTAKLLKVKKYRSVSKSTTMGLDLPLSFEYQFNGSLNLLIHRPMKQPHYLWFYDTIVKIDDWREPVVHTDNCLINSGVFDVCLFLPATVLRPPMLESPLFQHDIYGLVLAFTEGDEPVHITLEAPYNLSSNSVVRLLKVDMKSREGQHIYSGRSTCHIPGEMENKNTKQYSITLTSPEHSYGFKFSLKPANSSTDLEARWEFTHDDKNVSFFMPMSYYTYSSKSGGFLLDVFYGPVPDDSQKIMFAAYSTSDNFVKYTIETGGPMANYIKFYLDLRQNFHWRGVTLHNELALPTQKFKSETNFVFTYENAICNIAFKSLWNSDIIDFDATWSPHKKETPVWPFIEDKVAGDLYELDVHISHSSLGPACKIKGKVELHPIRFMSDLTVTIFGHAGRVYLYTEPISWNHFEHGLKVRIPLLSIWFGLHQKFIYIDKDMDARLDVNWSSNKKDSVYIDLSRRTFDEVDPLEKFNFTMIVPGYQLNATDELKFLVTGFNNALKVKTVPEAEFHSESTYMASVLSPRFTYALSNKFNSSLWPNIYDSLFTISGSSLEKTGRVTASIRKDSDSLLDVTAKLENMENKININVFSLRVDFHDEKVEYKLEGTVDKNTGDVEARNKGTFKKWDRTMDGKLRINYLTLNNGFLHEHIYQEGILTDSYNASLEVNKANRILHSSHHLTSYNGDNLTTCSLSLQGKLNDKVLGSHFGKISVLTPSQVYLLGADIDSGYTSTTSIKSAHGKINLHFNEAGKRKYLLETNTVLQIAEDIWNKTLSYDDEGGAHTLGKFNLDSKYILPVYGEKKMAIYADRVFTSQDDTLLSKFSVSAATESSEFGTIFLDVKECKDADEFKFKMSNEKHMFELFILNNPTVDSRKVQFNIFFKNRVSGIKLLTMASLMRHSGTYPNDFEFTFKGHQQSLGLLGGKDVPWVIVVANQPDYKELDIELESPLRLLPGGKLLFKWKKDKIFIIRLDYATAQASLIIRSTDNLNDQTLYWNFDHPTSKTHVKLNSRLNLEPDENWLWKQIEHDIQLSAGATHYVYKLTSDFHLLQTHSLLLGSLDSRTNEKSQLTVRAGKSISNSLYGSVELMNQETLYNAILTVGGNQIPFLVADFSSRTKNHNKLVRFDVTKTPDSVTMKLYDFTNKVVPIWLYQYKVEWNHMRGDTIVKSLKMKDEFYTEVDLQGKNYTFFNLTANKIDEGYHVDLQFFLLSEEPVQMVGFINNTNKIERRLDVRLHDEAHNYTIEGFFVRDKTGKAAKRFKFVLFEVGESEDNPPFSIMLEYNFPKNRGKFGIQRLKYSRASLGSLKPVHYYNNTLDFRYMIKTDMKRTEAELEWETKDTTSQLSAFVELKDDVHANVLYERSHSPTGYYQIESALFCKNITDAVKCSVSTSTNEHQVSTIEVVHRHDGLRTDIIFDIFKNPDDAITFLVLRQNEYSVSLKTGNKIILYMQLLDEVLNPKSNTTLITVNILGRMMYMEIGNDTSVANCKWGALDFGLYEILVHNSFRLCDDPANPNVLNLLGAVKGGGISIQYVKEGSYHGFAIIPPKSMDYAVGMSVSFEASPQLYFKWNTEQIENVWKVLPELLYNIKEIWTYYPNINIKFTGTTNVPNAASQLMPMFDDLITVTSDFTDGFEFLDNLNLGPYVKKFLVEIYNWLYEARFLIARRRHIVKLHCTDTINQLSSKVKEISKSKAEARKNVIDTIQSHVENFQPLKYVPGSFAQLLALSQYKDKGLSLLISRHMPWFRELFGKTIGIPGIIENILIGEFEKLLHEKTTWTNVDYVKNGVEKKITEFLPMEVDYRPHALLISVGKPKHLLMKLKKTFVEIPWSFAKYQVDQMQPRYEKWRTNLRHFLSLKDTGIAYVVGADNAISFDGRVIRPLFHTKCAHMLVMLTRGPTVGIVIEPQEKYPTRPNYKFTDADMMVIVDTNRKLIINGKPVKSGYMRFGAFSVIRRADEIEVTHKSGISLNCYYEENYCKVTVSPTKYASVAGLLGNYDSESTTDYLKSDWNFAENDTIWSNSWQLSADKQCDPYIPEPLGKQRCSSLFENQNSLRSCKLTEKMQLYDNFCASNPCAAATIYEEVCKSRYYDEAKINLTMCEKCPTPEIKINNPKELHEILFIGELSCMENLPFFLEQLRKTTSFRNVRLIYREVNFKREESIYDFDKTIYSLPGMNIWKYLLDNLDLEFELDSIKSVVLIDCEASTLCNPNAADLFIDYFGTDLTRELVKAGLTFHLITNQDIMVINQNRVNKKFRRQLLGIDRSTAYLMSHARKRNLKGKQSLRKHLSFNETKACGFMALRSDGSVFSTKALQKLKKKNHRRYFNKLIAAKINKAATRESLNCRICRCGQPCQICDKPINRPDLEESLDYDYVDVADFDDFESLGENSFEDYE